MQKIKYKQVEIGRLGVDSGQLVILDPAHLDKLPSYESLCQLRGEAVHVPLHDNWGHAFAKIERFGGDGTYRVIVCYEGKLVKEVVIKFHDEEEKP